MKTSNKLYISGIGMISAAGLNTVMTEASVNARIRCLQESEHYNIDLNPIIMGLVPDGALPELRYNAIVDESYLPWLKRFLRLGHVAMNEAMQGYTDETSIPLILACPENYPQCPHDFPKNFIEALINQSEANINKDLSRTVHTGRTGVLEAINLAKGYLNETDIESVLVGGIDSFQRPDLLMMLHEEDRALASGVVDGFAPGEGAGFLRITRNKAKALQTNQQKIYLSEPALTQESSHLYSKEPFLSNGLTAAMSEALAENSQNKVKRIYSSQNGERFWAKELNIAMIRNNKLLHENCEIEHPADCYGDLGAATGAVLIGLAAQYLFKQNKNLSSLVCCSSDHAYRASIMINS